MKKILFMIHDLGPGGAEKVLVNLVNNMDHTRFDITVVALFAGGVNEQFLSPCIHYYSVWQKCIRGNSKIMKLLNPSHLHKLCIKEHYDIEVSYLEGPSARIISGCPDPFTKLVSWIHIEQHTRKWAAGSFRSYEESVYCYSRFNQTVCVSQYVRQDFCSIYPMMKDVRVLYNTNESQQILELSKEPVDCNFSDAEIKLVGVGKINATKGFDKMARILKHLRQDGLPIHWYALGIGPDQEKITEWLQVERLQPWFTFLGYQTNPYKYVAKCDLFVCASTAEGFSTAATEALIMGTPVITTLVSGMPEMLGEHNEYGIVVENNEEALYQGIKELLTTPGLLEHYKHQALIRGKDFSTENTVKAVQNMFDGFFAEEQ